MIDGGSGQPAAPVTDRAAGARESGELLTVAWDSVEW